MCCVLRSGVVQCVGHIVCYAWCGLSWCTYVRYVLRAGQARDLTRTPSHRCPHRPVMRNGSSLESVLLHCDFFFCKVDANAHQPCSMGCMQTTVQVMCWSSPVPTNAGSVCCGNELGGWLASIPRAGAARREANKWFVRMCSRCRTSHSAQNVQGGGVCRRGHVLPALPRAVRCA